MRASYNIYILVILVATCFPFCKKDGRLTVLNTKLKCLISSDTTHLPGKNSYSTYEFEPNSNRLMLAKKVVGNTKLVDYRQVHYLTGAMPDKTVTFLNEHEYYETKFFYANGSTQPYKSELYFTNKLKSTADKNLWGFRFHYDAKERLETVEYNTPIKGDQEYLLHIFYNDQDNVTRMEYEFPSRQRIPNTVITVKAFDSHPNPYAGITNWKFLMLNANWDNYDPEPIITALSRNNPLDYSLGNLKREMTYTYNHYGYPISRLNINKSQGVEQHFAENFSYRCD
jgi:hypothetical protein